MMSSTENSPSISRRTDPNSHEDLYKKAKNTISAASRLLRRKIPQSGHLMTSKRFWMQSTPNEDVDVVITFPADISEATVWWFKGRLEKVDGLLLKTRSMTITKGTKTKPNCYAFHLSATYSGYLRGLERMQMPKPLREDLGGGMKEFTIKEASSFQSIEEMSDFLTSQERQAIILHLLHSLRADKGDVVGKLKFRDGEAIISRSLSAKIIYQVFPIHEKSQLQKLQKTWVQKFLDRQPIDKICNYFGVQIALYFAWLGHYTTALFIPAIVGLLFWFFFYGREELFEDIAFVIFAFFNVIWATLYLESWKRRSSELAYTWGTADQRDELLTEPRPQFKGTERISDISGKPELHYPEWKRNLFRYLVTFPVIGICLVVVFLSVFLILELQQWWDSIISEQGYISFLSYVPKVLLAIVIPILDSLYNKIAVWLNDMENYKLESNYEDQLVMKLILFQFVNSFLALFYTAFYLQDMDKLKELLAALLITRQVMGNIKESIIPYFKKEMKLAKLSFDLYGALSPTTENKKAEDQEEKEKLCSSTQKKKDRILSQVELESSAPDYDGTFEDYLEMFIQFGYVTLFSSAYPLAGLCALLNNLIEIRGDAFKLCFIHKRPFGTRVNSIGSWQNAMELMGIVGVMVNCALIGQSGQVHRMFPNITGTQTVLLIIILEHVLMLVKVWIAYIIPDIPSWLATEMAKIEWRRREAEKSLQIFNLTPTTSLETVDRAIQVPATPERQLSKSPSSSQSSLELKVFKANVSQSTNNVFTKSTESHSMSKMKRITPSPHLVTEEVGPSKTQLLYQRMASDSDLWLSIKAEQNKYQCHLEATKESPVNSNSHDDDDTSIVVNHDVNMPSLSLPETQRHPTPSEQRVLNQEEFDQRLKAKRALFSRKGRSLSLASFTNPVKRKMPKFLPLSKRTKTRCPPAKTSCPDQIYLHDNQIQGELEILGVESVIDVSGISQTQRE